MNGVVFPSSPLSTHARWIPQSRKGEKKKKEREKRDKERERRFDARISFLVSSRKQKDRKIGRDVCKVLLKFNRQIF